jgi:hypothetical protein
MGGVRWTYLGAEIDINEGPFAGADGDRSKDWFDPYVGTRVRWDLNRRFNLSAAGTVGGFGVGSDFAWSLKALAEYRINRRFSVIGGYRVIDYDYDDGFVYDVTMHGPILGLSVRW